MSRRTILYIFLLALGLRVAATFIFQGFDRKFEYQLIAENLLNGNGYAWDESGEMPLQPTSLFPPLYTWWCVLFIALFPGLPAVMYVAQAVIAAIGVFPAYAVGQRLFGSRGGILVAVGYAVYPELVFLSVRPVPEFAFVIAFLCILLLYFRVSDALQHGRGVMKSAVFLGAAGGAAALLKESSALLLLAMLTGLVIKHFKARKVLWTRAILPAIFAAGLVVLPWSVRNILVQNEPIVLRTGFGLNLWKGNHEGATGTGRAANGVDVRYWPPEQLDWLRATLPADEQDRERWFSIQARQFIREHPGEYLRLCLTRLSYFVLPDPTHPFARQPAYVVPFFLLLPIGLIGGVLAWRNKLVDPALALSIIFTLALYVPVYFVPRFRIIPTMILIIFAAYAITRVPDLSRARPNPPE